MAQADHTVGVCLYKLDAREEAVLKRVVTFSGAQGRNYALADLATAQLIVVSNDTVLDLAAMHTQGAMLVRIADQDSGQPYDLLMQRPLLVTRVMRTLDEARKLWVERLVAAPKALEPVHLSVVEPVVATSIVQEPVQAVAELPSSTVEIAASTPPVITVETPRATATNLEPALAATTVAIEAKQAVEVVAPVVLAPLEPAAVPVAEALAPAIPVETPNTEPPTASSGDCHHRALVVDDSAAIRKQLELELREAGIACDFAETGEEALQKVASHTYDLVFLDIIMPGIDGYETCRQMRMRKAMKKTPIIMLSAKTSPLDEVQGVIAGASTYLTKPVKSDQLQKTLKRVAMWLDNFQQARS